MTTVPGCEHFFQFSHREPQSGTSPTAGIDVVICRRCGEIRRTFSG